jgi:hypothetical protein
LRYFHLDCKRKLFLCSVNLISEFIKYKWKAKGKHGIHSPFIFSLVEKGIQSELTDSNFQSQNSKNLHFEQFVFKLLRYFKTQNIFIDEKKELTDWETFFRKNFSSLKIQLNLKELNKSSKNSSFDIIFISNSNQLLEKLLTLKPYSKNETVFLIEGIRSNKYSFEDWRKLCEMKTFHVSIDFFQSGLLILRSQQEKEHFTLKTS